MNELNKKSEGWRRARVTFPPYQAVDNRLLAPEIHRATDDKPEIKRNSNEDIQRKYERNIRENH